MRGVERLFVVATAAVALGRAAMALEVGCYADPPPVFADKTFAAASEEMKNTDKILVVKATAEWCGPCKMMDRTTWVDDRIVSWVRNNGLAIQVDVDKSPDVSKTLRIQAMPTMVAFKGGREFDRVVGYRDADQLLAWLEGVKRGERALDELKKKADEAKGDPGKMGMQERLRLADGLAQGGEPDRATEEYLWLWENMTKREPAMVGVRGSFMAGSMQRLAAEHAPAREAFVKVRDEAETRLKGEAKSWEDLSDWIVLNEVVGDQDKTLEWFDRVKHDPEARATLERVSFRLEQLLQERERWTDLVLLLGDPVKKLQKEHAQLAMMERMQLGDVDKKQVEEAVGYLREHFRDTAGKLHGACLAAGRAEDAERVALEAVKLDDTGEMRLALVRAATEFGKPGGAHLRLLDEAAAKGANGVEVKALRERTEEMLKGRG